MTEKLGSNGNFVLGSGRCGSTLVSETLKLHPDILSLSELLSCQGSRALKPGQISGKAYWEQLARPTLSLRTILTPETAPREFLYKSGGRFEIGNVPPLLVMTLPHLSECPDPLFDALAETVPSQPKQNIERHHSMMFARLQELCGGKVWVERTGMSLMYMRILNRMFPLAKFVMMYRDGRDVTLSLRTFKPVRPIIWNWIWFRKLGSNPIDLENPLGRNQMMRINERFFARKWTFRWMTENAPSLKQCAAFWSALMLQSVEEFSKLPLENRHFLRFENLTTNPKAELTRLAEFVGVEAAPAWLEKASKLPRSLEPRWKRLQPNEQRELEEWTEEARAAVEQQFSS